MKQNHLFDEARRLARRDDPETSKAAAEAVAPVLSRMHAWALGVVRQYGPGTSSEMSRSAGESTNHRLSRRLPELERKGLIVRGQSRPCAVTGMTAAVWGVSEHVLSTRLRS